MSGGNGQDNWELIALDELCERNIGVRDPRARPDESFIYVDISSVDNKRKQIVSPQRLLGRDASSRARQVILERDVLVATTRPNLNAVAIVPQELHDQIASTGFCVLRPSDKLDPEYLFGFVQSHDFVRRLSDLVKGALYPAVTERHVRAQKIPLPPMEQQRRIAARLRGQLSILAEARTALKAQLAAAESLAAAHLRAVFESEEAKCWQRIRLEEISEIAGGVTLGRDLRGRPTRNVSYLRVANVKDGHLDLTTVKTTPATEEEIAACRLQRGDVLLTEGGDPDKLGRGTFWNEEISECIHQNHIFRVRFDLTAFEPSFVGYQLASAYGKAYFLRHAKQTTGIATINRRVLGAFPLMIPSFTEQRRIASGLDVEFSASASLRFSVQEKLRELEKLPAALLRSAFSPNGG